MATSMSIQQEVAGMERAFLQELGQVQPGAYDIQLWQLLAISKMPGNDVEQLHAAFQYGFLQGQRAGAEKQTQKLALSVTEAAELLGVSRSTIYTLIHRADFPCLNLGRRTVISREGLVKWLKQQTERDAGQQPWQPI